MSAASVNEQVTARYTAQLVDEDGNNILLSDIVSLVLTLYEKSTGNIINSRDVQDVLNNNNVTVSSSGALTWILQPADNIMVTENPVSELHVAFFQGVYSSTKHLKHEYAYRVNALEKVS